MTGICIELKTTCKHCSTPLMLNAFTEDILCSACNKTNSFPAETWEGLLESAVKEAPRFKPGEGQPSTVWRGEYSYNLLYGRQEPRCGSCKQGVDTAKLEEYSLAGGLKCTKCSAPVFVRKPSEMIAACFPAVKFLVGEDDDQLSKNTASGSLPSSAKPVLFTCPSCAGNLEIDGSDRMVSCKYCDSQIYLPDDLWFRLHPAKSVERWYMILEGSGIFQKPSGKTKEGNTVSMPNWGYFSDLTCDKEGNVYFACTEDGSDDLMVWSIDKDLKTKWIKKDFKLGYEGTGITITNDGNLYLWNKSKHSLLKLSSKDGSTIQKLEGKPASAENPMQFSLKRCGTLVCCPDGTILAIVNNTVVRFSPQGERVQLWSAKKWGLFSSGVGKPIPNEEAEWAPYIKEVGSVPKRIDSDLTSLNIGWDGFLYMLDKSSSESKLAKYSMEGTQLWKKDVPLRYKDCKPCADSRGNVFILGTDDKSNTNLIKYNPSSGEFETVLTDLMVNGVLDDEQHLAVTPEGKVYILNTSGGMKVFSPDMKMVYRSEESEEDDNDVLEAKKKQEEKDKEFS